MGQHGIVTVSFYNFDRGPLFGEFLYSLHTTLALHESSTTNMVKNTSMLSNQ